MHRLINCLDFFINFLPDFLLIILNVRLCLLDYSDAIHAVSGGLDTPLRLVKAFHVPHGGNAAMRFSSREDRAT